MNLQRIIDDLLFLENDFGKLNTGVNQYYYFLSQITGINDNSTNPEDEYETFLNEGKAISPKDAARCILDYVRTTKFLRGIYATILKSREHFPNEKIEILYAGCGPFASLAIAFCKKFKDTEITFSLLDIHQRSLDSAKRIFQELKLEDYASEYIKADAVNYRPDKGRKFHIIICEMMQKTLEKEPQFAVTLNLVNHLREGGFFVPQKITIEAFLANLEKEFAIDEDLNSKIARIYLGRIFELSAKTAFSKKELLRPKNIKIPKGEFEKLNLLLSTKVLVSDNFLIKDYDSGITYPTILHDFPKLQENQEIKFCYILDKDPHFEYKLV